jgi:hypothetical protein
MQTIECAIEEIITAHPNLYLEHCVAMTVALLKRQADAPVEFIVQCAGIDSPALRGQDEFLLRLAWSEVTAFKARRIWQTEQPKSIIERAAVALAALLFARLLPAGQMRVTRAGERADYWLPQLRCALEVSGTTQPRLLARRQREKIAQVLSNPLRWNGYVVICCCAPRQRIIRWSYHQQEGTVA